MKTDADERSVLVLLDLKAAFDTIDRIILIDHLKTWVGITGSAPNWFSSDLSDSFVSSSAALSCGGPGVLFWDWFCMYLLLLGHILGTFKGVVVTQMTSFQTALMP